VAENTGILAGAGSSGGTLGGSGRNTGMVGWKCGRARQGMSEQGLKEIVSRATLEVIGQSMEWCGRHWVR
jgi:hypothetical protein